MTATRKRLGLPILTALLLLGAAIALNQHGWISPAPSHDEPACVAKKAGGQRIRTSNARNCSTHEAPPKSTSVVAVLVRTEQGTPLGGLTVAWDSAVAGQKHASGQGVTDRAGRLEVPLFGQYPLVFHSKDESWLLPAEPQTPQRAKPIELVARNSVSLKLSIVGAADEPFVGEAAVSAIGEAGAGGRYYRQLLFKGDAPVEVEQAPVGHDLKVYARCSMIGYDAQEFVVSKEQVARRELVILRLVRSERPEFGVVAVDFSRWPGTPSAFNVLGTGNHGEGTTGSADEASKDRIWTSRPVPSGAYFVRIYGRPNWESAPFELSPGQTYTFVPDDYLPASMTVRVLDETGKPLAGAIVTRDTKRYVRYGIDSKVAQDTDHGGGLSAISAADGRARISGLRPGTHQFQVEAYGYEPHFLTLALPAGATTDGGDVVLKKAIGRIKVVLKNRKEHQKSFFLGVMQVRGSDVRTVRKMTASEWVFDALPLREYCVGISVGKGGKAGSQNVTLTIANPDQIVEIDVGDLVEGYPEEK
jgi:Carboxypeptidase regulatory-like domain